MFIADFKHKYNYICSVGLWQSLFKPQNYVEVGEVLAITTLLDVHTTLFITHSAALRGFTEPIGKETWL